MKAVRSGCYFSGRNLSFCLLAFSAVVCQARNEPVVALSPLPRVEMAVGAGWFVKNSDVASSSSEIRRGKQRMGPSVPIPSPRAGAYLESWEYDKHHDVAADILVYDVTGKKHYSVYDVIGDDPDGLEMRLGMVENSETGQSKPQLHIVRTRSSQCRQVVAGVPVCGRLEDSLLDSINQMPVKLFSMAGSGDFPVIELEVVPSPSPVAGADTPPVSSLMQSGGSDNSKLKRQDSVDSTRESTPDDQNASPSDSGSNAELGGKAVAAGGGNGDDKKEYRFSEKVAKPLETVLSYPLTTLLGSFAYATAAWFWEMIKSTITSDPANDRRVAGEIQYARLSQYFGGSTVHLNLSRKAFDMQYAEQNTSEYRATGAYETYGFILKGQFLRAFRNGVQVPEYKGCPDGCLDFPTWNNCEIWIAVRESALNEQLARVHPNASSIVFTGAPRDIKPDGWCPCVRCEVPEQEMPQSSGLAVAGTAWTTMYPLISAGVGLLGDVFGYRKTVYRWWVESFIARHIYK